MKNIFIIINFTAQDNNNFLIADLKDKENPKNIFSSKFETSEKLEELLKIAEEHKAEGFIIMFGDISESGIFNKPFTMDKHFNTLVEVVEKVKEQVKERNPLNKELENLINEFKTVDTKKIFIRLSEILKKYFPQFAELPEKMQPQTDRDFLDLSIEIYKLLYSKVHFIDYESDKIDNAVMKEPFMNLLLEYKFNYYGHEIFGAYGFNIVDRLENGNIKIAPITDEEKENKNILN